MLIIQALINSFILCCCALAAQNEVPLKFSRFVDLDRNYNLEAFKKYTQITAGDSGVVSIFHMDLPENDPLVEVIKSKFIDQDSRSWFNVETASQKCVRVYLRTTDLQHPEVRRAQSRAVQGIQSSHFGIKLQSHSTFLVWDAEGKQAVYIKFGGEDQTTRKATIENAIRISDFIEASQKSADHKDKISFFPERVGVVLGGDREFSYSLRSISPEKSLVHGELLPVHGFLGSPLLDDFAKSRGMTKKDFLISEYVKPLAREMAKANFVYGVYPESHTQNLVLQADLGKKSILEISFKDMNDISLDPLMLEVLGRKSPSAHLVRSIINRTHVSNLSPKIAWTSGAGWVNAAYLGGMNIKALSEKPDEMFSIFLNEYKREVSRITGVSLSSLKVGIPEDRHNFPGYREFQSIWRAVIEAKFPKNIEISGRSSELEKFFLKAYQENRASPMSPEDRVRFESKLGFRFFKDTVYTLYHQDQKNWIVALDSKSKKPVGLAFGFEDSELEIKKSGFLSCFFSQLH